MFQLLLDCSQVFFLAMFASIPFYWSILLSQSLRNFHFMILLSDKQINWTCRTLSSKSEKLQLYPHLDWLSVHSVVLYWKSRSPNYSYFFLPITTVSWLYVMMACSTRCWYWLILLAPCIFPTNFIYIFNSHSYQYQINLTRNLKQYIKKWHLIDTYLPSSFYLFILTVTHISIYWAKEF